MNYTLQYASNFFLNLHRQRNFQKMLIPSSENLALLGNVCSLDTGESRKLYKDFLTYASGKWKHVYIVPGPWEYASFIAPRTHQSNIDSLYKLSKEYKNINVLNNSIVNLPNVHINLIGSTLWINKPHMRYPCMFEYAYIWHKHFNGFINVMENQMKLWHKEDISYLVNTIDPKMRYIVLSHHLPSPTLLAKEDKAMESSNLDNYMQKPIEVWLGGAGDRHVTGVLGNDVFAGTNPFTVFSTAKCSVLSSYNPEAYISLKTSPV